MSGPERIGKIVSVSAVLLALLVATPALGALPRGYDVQRIESPNPQQGANFGLGLIGHTDLNADGADDFLIPQTATGPNGDGQIFVFSGATGGVIDTVNAPDAGNPGNAPSGNNRAGFGLFTSTIADLGSCPGGSSGANCAAPSTTTDGVDEIVAGATGIDIPTTGAPNGVAVDIGRAYVIDGRTRAVLKRIDMPTADRLEHATFPAGPPNPHTPSFGRTVLAPAGLPPCAGNQGIGPCESLPNSVAIGDIDGAFDADTNDVADLVIGAPTYDEQNASNPACSPGQCHEAGRAYIYRGEDVMDPANGGAAVPLQVPLRRLRNLTAQTDDPISSAQTNSELFSQAVFPIGDVGRCNALATPAGDVCPNASSTNVPDGSPEVVISSFRTDLPSNADVPDPAFFDVGVNMLVDGRTGSVLAIYQHPEPQPGSIFGFTLHNEPAPGDLGSTVLPDVLIPAMRQNVDFNAQGRAYVMNGNFKAGANGINFAQLNDPTPGSGGNFGVSSAGVGNLVSDAEGAPRNELLIGAFGPHNPGTNADIINDIHVFNAVSERLLQSIPDPDQQKGSSFGTALAPIGDVNDDGFLDFTVSADLWDANDTTGRNQGRAYILRSDNSPGPAQNPPVISLPPASGCPAGTSAGVSCQQNGAGGLDITGTAGANRIVGSTGRDVIRCGDGDDVVQAGPGNDDIRCGAGNDTIEAGAGDDRADGESGNDRVDGGAGRDRLSGGTGNDTGVAGSGDDTVGGGAGNDRLSGNEGADRVSGNAGNDRMAGNEGADRLDGGHNSDRVNGNSGNDRVAGGRTGNDRLNGNSGSDRLSGGSGRDRLVGGTGRDRLSGGSGNDRLNTRDLTQDDRASCGGGRRDVASVDRGDRASGCERVRRRG